VATVTQLGELKTYYHRKWEDFQPIPQDTLTAIVHIGGLALPFIGLLYKPAGRVISFTATSLNIFHSGSVFRLEFGNSRIWNARAYGQLWSIVKNGAELIGTVAHLRIGLAIHTVMNLRENFYELREKWNGEKILRIVSNALYLLTLVNFSNPVYYGIVGVSFVFQACLSLEKARTDFCGAKTWTEMKILDAVAHVAMTYIFCDKAATAFIQYTKYGTEIPIAVPRIPRTVVLMQSLSKLNEETLKRDFFQNSKELAESVTPLALSQFAQQKGQKDLVYYTSRAHGAQARVILINMCLGYNAPHRIFWKLFPLEERWAASSDAENPAEVAAHMEDAIRTILVEQPEEDGLPVIVTGGTTMTRYLESEILKNPEISPKAASGITDGSMRAVTMTPNEMGELQVSQVVDPNSILN